MDRVGWLCRYCFGLVLGQPRIHGCKAERNAAMLHEYEQGSSIGTIAAQYRLSYTRVLQIVARGERLKALREKVQG
jgi:Mor family transcriptional regulator